MFVYVFLYVYIYCGWLNFMATIGIYENNYNLQLSYLNKVEK